MKTYTSLGWQVRLWLFSAYHVSMMLTFPNDSNVFCSIMDCLLTDKKALIYILPLDTKCCQFHSHTDTAMQPEQNVSSNLRPKRANWQLTSCKWYFLCPDCVSHVSAGTRVMRNGFPDSIIPLCLPISQIGHCDRIWPWPKCVRAALGSTQGWDYLQGWSVVSLPTDIFLCTNDLYETYRWPSGDLYHQEDPDRWGISLQQPF